MNGDPPLLASIPDVQQGRVPFASWVRVEGLVVTSPVIDAPVGGGSVFTVSDPGGGLYSAITVRVLASPADVPFERGEGVTLEAEVTDGGTWLELRTLPELLAYDGLVAEPPPLVIEMETLQSFAVEPRRGVLVTTETRGGLAHGDHPRRELGVVGAPCCLCVTEAVLERA